MSEMPDTLWISPHGDRNDAGGLHVAGTAPDRFARGDETEYARVTTSVRLARWEDGHPDRYSVSVPHPQGGHWKEVLTDENRRRWITEGKTRDEARSAALDQAEGVRDAG